MDQNRTEQPGLKLQRVVEVWCHRWDTGDAARPELDVAELVPAAKPARKQPLSLIQKLGEFDSALSLEEFAAIYIDGDRSLKLKCRALQHAVKTDGIPFFRRGRRMKFDPVELIEYIRKRSFTAKKPARADGRDITRRIAARRKR